MNKTKSDKEAGELTLEDYQKLIENIRIRLNVLNASVFLLEEKLVHDNNTSNYLEKINTELETIRELTLPNSIHLHNRN